MDTPILLAVVGTLLAAGILLGFLLKLLKKPIKWGFKLLLHALAGFVLLFVFNFFGAWAGLSIASTWLNAAVAGVFGIPGVIVLLLLKYIL